MNNITEKDLLRIIDEVIEVYHKDTLDKNIPEVTRDEYTKGYLYVKSSMSLLKQKLNIG